MGFSMITAASLTTYVGTSAQANFCAYGIVRISQSLIIKQFYDIFTTKSGTIKDF